jgi:nucleoside-diphosphate-sugar epimerase
MKITVIGATGLIGSKVVHILEREGHDLVASSRETADVLTGRGLTEALMGADAVVDVAAELARVAVESPLNGIHNIGGPQRDSLVTE